MKRYVVILPVICLLISFYVIGIYNSRHEALNYVTIETKQELYIITLSDHKNNVILSETLTKEPSISKISKDVIEITLNLGNPLSYSYFFNPSTGQLSPTYENIIYCNSKYVIYMNQKYLIVQDIFDSDNYYQKIELDISPVAVSSSAITSIRFLDLETIEIKYLKGSSYIETIKIIKLN